MEDENISYEMLQDLVRQERRSNRVTPVEARFWPRTREFLLQMKEEFRAEQAKDPFSRKTTMLRDEVVNAQSAADRLFALRERKMALFALAQRDKPERPEGLTPNEENLYDRIIATLFAGRRELLEGAAQEEIDQPVEMAKPRGPALAAPKPVAVPEPEPEPVPVEVPADTPVDDMVTIRALGDIPPFVGPDMQTYLLKEGDIASVPPAIGKLLERRKKAAIIESD